MDFKEKVVLVTGSSRSLGKQIAMDFLKQGAYVIFNYCNSDGSTLKEELEKNYKDKYLLIKCDISNEEEVENMINQIINKFSKIDILVNNAGICNDTLFDEKKKEDFIRTLEVNVVGTYLVTKHVGKIMKENKSGKIINIASDNGIDNNYPESCDYDASKAGVISLTHNMAKYYAPFVNVNCVCPGWIDTDMNKDLSSNQKEEINSNILLKRFANKEEISNVVLFLASDLASYVNDAIIVANGGYDGR